MPSVVEQALAELNKEDTAPSNTGGKGIAEQALAALSRDESELFITTELLNDPNKQIEDYIVPGKKQAMTDYFNLSDDPQAERKKFVETQMLATGLDIEPEVASVLYDDAKKSGYIDSIRQTLIADPDDIPITPEPLKKKIGLFEKIRTMTKMDWLKRLPFGSVAGATDTMNLALSAKRLERNEYETIGRLKKRYQEYLEYSQYAEPLYPEEIRYSKGLNPNEEGLPDNELSDYGLRQRAVDTKTVEEYLLKQAEVAERGETFGAQVFSGATYLPAWMIEFALTGGLSKIGNEAARQIGVKLLRGYSKTTAGKIALRAAGWTGGAVTRTTLGLSHRVIGGVIERTLPKQMHFDDEDNLIIDIEGEKWATALLKSWGDVVIESASEESGEAITAALKKFPFMGKVFNQLEKITGKSVLLTKGGYSNFIGEIGEERLGTLLRAITGTDDFGAGKDTSILERLAAGIEQDIKNFPVEATVLSLPAGGQVVLSRISSEQVAVEKPIEAAVEKPVPEPTLREPSMIEEKLPEPVTEVPLDKSGISLEDLEGTPIPTNEDGTITLFHRTTPESVSKIRKTGNFVSKEQGKVFFSTKEKGQAEGFGSEIVEIQIDPSKVELDDAFRDGEIHVAINNKDIILKDLARPATETVTKGKKPWEMTKEEWASGSELSEAYHRNGIISALGENKPVSRQVLEEYKSEKWAQEALTRPAAEVKASEKGFGESNTIYKKEDALAAIERIKQKITDKEGFFKGEKGEQDIEGWDDLVKIGGYYFEGGLRSFAEWSKQMVTDFGGNISPHLKSIWDDLQKNEALIESEQPSGLTRDEITGLTREQAKALREKQAEGKPVGFKVGVQASKGKIAQIRTEYQQKTKSIETIKKSLVNYANQNLPLNERGKMLARVKNAKTEKDLKEAIELADKYSEQYNQRLLRNKIQKEIKRAKPKKKEGILKGKFTADIQNQLDEIATNLTGDREQARAKIVENITAYENGSIQYEQMREENDKLSMAGVKGMTANELQHVLDNIVSLKEKGKTIRQAERNRQNERIGQIKTEMVNILTGGKGLKKGAESVPRESLAANKTFIERLVNWQYGWDNLLDKLSKFHESKPYQSPLSHFGNEVHQAEVLEALGIEKWVNEIADNAMKIFDVQNRKDLSAALGELQKETILGPFVNADGVEIKLELTRDQLIKKYMELADPTLEATFKGGVNEETGRPYGMRWTDEIIETVKNELTEQEKKWADWQLSFYRKYYDSVNVVYRDVYGVDLPFNLFYSPIGRDVEVEIPENILLAKEAVHYASTINGSLKSRQPNIKPLKFNSATQILTNHVVKMEHFKGWTEAMRDMRRIFGNPDIRRSIEQYHGRRILKTIDEFIEDMARGGVARGKTNRSADLVRRNFTLSILGLKPAIALKQIPSVIAYTSEMPFGDFVSGVGDFWSKPIENYKFLVGHSAILRKRYSKGFERDIRFAMQKSWSKVLAGKGNFSDWFMALIRSGDKFATMQGGWAKYKSELKKGKTIEQAIAEAERTTNRTQPTSDISTLAAGQRGGSFVKLLTMFQNQPNKYFRIIADNARNIRFHRGSSVKAATNILTAWVVLPMLFQFIADAFRFKKEHQLQAALLGPINNLLILGAFAKNAVGWTMGELFDYQGSPVVSTAQKTQYGISKLAKDDVKTEDVVAAIEYFAEAAGQAAGLPTPYFVQLEKAVRKGKPKQLIFSEYSLKEDKKKKKRRISRLRRK